MKAESETAKGATALLAASNDDSKEDMSASLTREEAIRIRISQLAFTT